MDDPKILKKLDEILKILNGNGHIGMCAKVNVMWGVGIWVVLAVGAQLVIAVRLLLMG